MQGQQNIEYYSLLEYSAALFAEWFLMIWRKVSPTSSKVQCPWPYTSNLWRWRQHIPLKCQE